MVLVGLGSAENGQNISGLHQHKKILENNIEGEKYY